MKNYLINKINVIVLVALLCTSGCTKLDEELYGRVTPENFFKTDAEVLSALAGVYSNMGFAVNGANAWRLLHMGTDEFIIVARSDGRWLDGSVYIEFFEHKWTPVNNRLGSYADVFRAIGSANAILESLQSSSNAANLKAQIAEARGIRAYAYFYAMDLWGNVPLVTTARIEPTNLPTNSTRKEIFDFVISELTAASADLPSAKTVTAAYYPRMTKEAAYAIMAIAYLNGEVYAGKTYWPECIDMCDKVTAGGYILTPNYFSNFVPANEGSKEFIYAISQDPSKTAGSNNFAQRTLHDAHRFKYNLPFTPQNGFNIVEDAYNRYENQDVRKSMILAGPQFAADGVTPLKNIAGTANLVLVPIASPKNAAENEGYRLIKWQPDNTWVNGGGSNDVATIRYSEILLTKAEALLRAGGAGAGTAMGLVNQVRTRSNATSLTSITLNDILNERGRELIWEGTRRRDMIRFGTFFTWTPFFKPNVTPTFRGLLPIPAAELGANPKLKQNPGY